MLDSLSGSGFGGLLLALGGIVVLAVLALVLRRRKRRHHHALVAGHRLAVVDQIPIDETRRLVLIQRDDIQHLVILGGGSDFLVESGIGAARAHEAPHALAVTTRDETPAAPARPAQPLAAPAAEPLPAAAPVAHDVDPPRPAAARAIAEAATVPPRQPAAMEPGRPRPVSPMRPATGERPEAGPRVAVKLDPHFAGMVEQLEETLRRPAVASIRSAQATAAAASAPQEIAGPAPTARPVPEVQPAAFAANAPAPAAAPEILPPTTSPEVAGTAASPAVIAPTAEDRPAPTDPFELEMADLLGRTKRS